MNVILHTTTAIGIAVSVTDTTRADDSPGLTETIPTGLYAFTLGIISHGALDYIPHCYPIHSALDVISGLTMILVTTWLTNPRYRLIVGLAFLGAILPDVLDLGPKILNKELNLGLTVPDNIFPWHWDDYSGSIYSGDCSVSILNHVLLLITIATIIWIRRRDCGNMFRRNAVKDGV